MNDPILLRKKIRQVLSALPPSRSSVSEEFLTEQLNRFFPEPVKLDELRAAIECNHGKGWVDYRRNHDEERDEWFLTDAGKRKEGL